MKPVRFLGDSRKVLREFPKTARQQAGYQLGRLQTGIQANDFKPMPSIGKGVEEVRVWAESWHVPRDIHGSARGGCLCDPRLPQNNPNHVSARY